MTYNSFVVFSKEIIQAKFPKSLMPDSSKSSCYCNLLQKNSTQAIKLGYNDKVSLYILPNLTKTIQLGIIILQAPY